MAAPPAPWHVTRRQGRDVKRRAGVRFICGGCGWSTAVRRLENAARTAMAVHLAVHHGPELGVGICANCQAPTDHLRAVTPGHPDAWLCARCAPAPADLATAPEGQVIA